jgi:hypothetical protein
MSNNIALSDNYTNNENTLTQQLIMYRERNKRIAQQKKTTHSDTVAPEKSIQPPAASELTKNEVQLSYKTKFNWKKKELDFRIEASEKSTECSFTFSKTSTSNHLLSFFGYKIDISSQIDQVKHKMQRFFIESKSHNALIGKFSELKFAMMATLLSTLGVSPSEIEILKKESLKTAIKNNIQSFEKNEYNSELLTVFSSTTTDKGRIKIFSELRNQLIKQMKNYGAPDYYTNNKINTIKIDQIKKILGDLLEEDQSLKYIQKFLQMSELSQSPNNQLSYSDINKKISRLQVYITRVNQRISGIQRRLITKHVALKHMANSKHTITAKL